jgi:hypothetical protein
MSTDTAGRAKSYVKALIDKSVPVDCAGTRSLGTVTLDEELGRLDAE